MDSNNDKLIRSKKVALIGVFSALLIVVRLIRIPIRLPGFGGLPWLIILMISSILIPVNFSATDVALIGGSFSAFALDTPPGPYQLVKYISAAIPIDLLNKLSKSHGIISQIIIGAVSYGISISATILTLTIFGIRMQALAFGAPYIIGLHVIFGAIGGFISYTITKKVIRDNLLAN